MNGLTRTHGSACETCRRRRRKCDKTVPTCRQCVDRGILCEGYVWRWTEAVSSSPSCVSKKRDTFPQSQARRLSRLNKQTPGDDGGTPISKHQLHSSRKRSASRTSTDPRTNGSSGSTSTVSPPSLHESANSCECEYMLDSSTIQDGLGDLVNYG